MTTTHLGMPSASGEHAQLPFAITLETGSSAQNHTGSWRSERPVYVDLLPPCNKACPAGENIQGWLYHAEAGDYETAWREIMNNNPLPATMGRVCYHDCQTACNRAQVDQAVGINAIERFLGDTALEEGWRVEPLLPPTGKKVLVIGAGPSGLSAAYHLARMGHQVVIRDQSEEPGGMMRYGIPAYRLPRKVLDAEIQRIKDLGVVFEMNTKVESLAGLSDEFDAIFTAVGADLGRNINIPAGSASEIVNAVDMLHDAPEDADEKPLLGRRVVVYGGGNTAVDAARTAKRLGATESVILYRRTREKMPAHDSEVMEATEEGITMRWLSTVNRVDQGTVKIEKMAMDADGNLTPTGEYEDLDADSLVMAVGQKSDLSLFEDDPAIEIERGVAIVDDNMMTGHEGVFAGGDMTPGEKNVTVAIGHGKKAARNIDGYLRGEPFVHDPIPADATLDRMTTWYYTEAPHQVRPKLDAIRRSDNFDEVVLGLDAQSALLEARRCMSCGNCFGCDNCFGVCPDNAITKLGVAEFEFKYDYCKGCGICAEECPCGAISMIPEEN